MTLILAHPMSCTYWSEVDGPLDGCAVARALREDPRTASAYLIALTWYAQPEDKCRALEAGFDAHVAKPPDLGTLEGLLARVAVHGTRAGGEASPAD